MNERLRKARQRTIGKLSLEDFVGTHLLQGFERRTLDRMLADYSGNLRAFPCTVTAICLDGEDYFFWADTGLRNSWSSPPTLGHIEVAAGSYATAACDRKLVIEIRTRLDVHETFNWKNDVLEASSLYATCDNLDGRVLFELGDEITVNPTQVKFLSRWYTDVDQQPSWFESKDPDEPAPIEIVGAFKAYEPKHGSRKKGRLRHAP